jgi:Rrf2 family protein
MSASNSRFRTAVHAMAVIAYLSDQQATSDHVAASVATDASVVRRLLSLLRQAGLVQALPGRAGGYVLARPARLITLKDVFEAVDADDLFPKPEREPNPGCPVGSTIHAALDEPLALARQALLQRLSATTLADVLASAVAR